MSFQAGIVYFDGRGIEESEAVAISGWVTSNDCESPTYMRQPGVFLAHAASRFKRRTPGETQPCLGHIGAAVTFDGRLDDRQDILLRVRTALRGDTSDAALAVAVYEMWGAEGFAHLIGDWSLAIWDAQRRTVVLASDFAGVRPFYYSVERNRVLWSTRLRPLVDWMRADELDDLYVAGFLAFGGCPNRTPYRGIFSVPPGHSVQVTEDGARIRPFWNMPFGHTIRYRRESEYDDHLWSLFREAVRCRVPSDVRWLCELSGGFDSSSVVSMAAELIRSGEIKAEQPTALSFEHDGSLDKPFYKAVAQFCGVDSIHLSTATYPFLTDTDAGGTQPAFWGPLQSHTAAIARQIDATTYMTGQLGDTIMGNWWDDSDQVAGLLRNAHIGSALEQALAWSKVLRIPIAWVLWRAFLSSLPPTRITAKWCLPNDWCAMDRNVEDSIAPAFRRRTGLSDPRTLFSQKWIHARPERRRHFRALMQTLELRRLQPPEPLEHLNYVHPYAHRPLITFMLSIPADVACRPGEPRRLMRRALRQLWPPELRKRRSKDAFGGVFLDSLRPLANSFCKKDQPLRVVESGYVDRESLQRRMARLSLSLTCGESQLRQIILLELWLREREGRLWSQPICSPGASGTGCKTGTEQGIFNVLDTV